MATTTNEDDVSPSLRYPVYSEMIYAAIEALDEKGGSSKPAIAKFIDANYSGLPPTHTSLLYHHLRRLKESGQLVMVKHSYKLPRHGGVENGPPRKRGRPPKPKNTSDQVESGETLNHGGGGETGFAVSPRKRGRPPKQKITSDQVEDVMLEMMNHGGGDVNLQSPRKRGRPPKLQRVSFYVTENNGDSETEFPTAARKRGRPPKPKDSSLPEVVKVKRPRGRPPGSLVAAVTGKRPRGRPPMFKNPFAMVSEKRLPGRPPLFKNVPLAPATEKRPRGRPPSSLKLGGVVPKGKIAKKGSGKKRGRPRKNPLASPAFMVVPEN